MDNQNKAGNMIIKGGDGGINSNGGDCHVGPGIYKAGDAIQTINYLEIIDSLINNINNSNLEKDKKESLMKKLQDGIGLVVNTATLTKLILSLLT
jgi:hypothetical protein